MKTFRRCSLLLCAFVFLGFGKKEPPLAVTFNVETGAHDSESFATPVQVSNPPRTIFVEKMPSITDREIHSVFPFAAADGTLGCAFQLDDHGRMWLDSLSVEKKGRSLVAFVNGRAVACLLIDKEINDGLISIPAGLTQQEVAILVKKYPVMGKKKK